jgi:hypothetical protein
MHIGNLRNYGGGATLLTDWASAVMSQYSTYYAVPLLCQGWPALANYAASRMAHYAELNAGVSAVYDSGAGTVTVTSPAAGSVTVSGDGGAGSTHYGTEVSANITLAANTPVTFTPTLLP